MMTNDSPKQYLLRNYSHIKFQPLECFRTFREIFGFICIDPAHAWQDQLDLVAPYIATFFWIGKYDPISADPVGR